MSNFIKIIYQNRKINSIKDLLDKEKIINITPAKFLDEEDPETKVKNREAFFNAFSFQEKKQLGLNTSSDINESTKIVPSAILWISIDNVKKELIRIDSQFVQKKDYNAFLSEEIKKIVNSDFYVKSNFTKTYPKCQVFIWCKSLEKLGSNISINEIKGDLINVSDYVESLTINVSETGGNFSLKLPFLPGKGTINISEGKKNKTVNLWDLNKKNIHNSVVKETIHEQIKISSEIFNTSLNKDLQTTNGDIRRENFLQNALSANDIVFIKFEKLSIEKKNNQNTYDFNIQNSEIVDEYYDMIGLIDSVNVSTNPSTIDVDVQGRDLMKILLDDGTFFFPSSFSKESSLGGVFNNMTNEVDGENSFNLLIKNSEKVNSRLIASGLINEFHMATEASKIGNLVNSIVRLLSNIQICPDSVFDSYQNGHNEENKVIDKRTKFKKKEEKTTSSKK